MLGEQKYHCHATMPIKPNRPLRCIQSCTPSAIDKQIHNKCNRPSLSRSRRLYRPYTALAVFPSPSGALNTRPLAVDVYIALADSRVPWRNFSSKTRVWDKVPEGSTLIFGDGLVVRTDPRSPEMSPFIELLYRFRNSTLFVESRLL